MKYIKLRGKYAVDDKEFASVSDEDFKDVVKHKWHVVHTNPNSDVYYIQKGDKEYLHRYIAKKIFGKTPGKTIDHIDRNTFNNTRENLRAVNWTQQMRNRRPQSENPGVYESKNGKYQAVIKVNCKTVSLGVYKEKEDAIKIREFADFVRDKLEEKIECDDIIELIKEVKEKFQVSRNRDKRIVIEKCKIEKLEINFN